MYKSGRWLGFILLSGAGLVAQGPLFRALELPVPANAQRNLATADFNGDGAVDLMTEGPVLYLNDGSGRFTAGPAFTWPGSPASTIDPPAVGDFTGDGRPDVFFAGTGGTSTILTVAANGVMSTVTATTPLPPPPGVALAYFPTTVAAADIDGDGDLDLVLAFGGSQVNHHTGPAQVRVWINNGANVFVDATSTRMPAVSLLNYFSVFSLVDIDLDGDPDLVATDGYNGLAYSTTVALNNGAGVFTLAPPVPGAAPGSFAGAKGIVDADGDGLPDLVGSSIGSSSQELFWRNLGNGAFATPLMTVIASPAVAYAAANLDGLPGDEILRFRADTCEVGHFVAGSGFAPPTQAFRFALASYTRAPQFKDLDGDGDPDILICGAIGYRLLFTNAAGQLVASPTPRLASVGFAGSQIGDANADGKPDLITVELGATGYQIAVEINDGSGMFTAGGVAATPFGLGAFGVGQVVPQVFDQDGDGDADLFIAPGIYSSGTAPTGSGLLLVNQGGTYVAAGSVALPPYCRSVASGDLDGDGDQDLVIGVTGSQTSGSGLASSYVVYNQGGGVLSAAVALPVQHITSNIVLFDADGDGDLDIVEANGGGTFPPPDTCALFLNLGGGIFAASNSLPPIAATTVLAADLDGDGDVDLVLDGIILSNNGSGVFTQVGPLPTPLAGYFGSPLAAFDADGDGDLDLAEASGSLYINLGLGTFAPPQPLCDTKPYFDSRSIADLDGDGDQDIAGRDIYFNTTRQLSRGALARPGRIASLDLYGPAGSTWHLFASAGAASVAAPPFGTVLIDPATALLVATGVMPATGSTSFSALAPAGPAAVGFSVAWQAFVSGQNRLTGRQVTTVVAY